MCTLQKKDTETKTVTETSQEGFVDQPDTNWPKFKLENVVFPSNHPWVTNKHITTGSLWMYLDKRFCKHESVSLSTACQTAYMMLLGHKILLWVQVCEVSLRHLSKCVFLFNSVWTLSTWGWYQAADLVPKTDPTITLFAFLEDWIWTGFPQPLLWFINLLECPTEGMKQRIFKKCIGNGLRAPTPLVLTTLQTLPSPWPWKNPLISILLHFNGNFIR